MSKRCLRVWVDCEDETCNGCQLHDDGYGYCTAFSVDLEQRPSGGLVPHVFRCPQCIDAESKALTQCGTEAKP